MNTLIELQQLARMNPGLTGSVEAQAAWYEAKGRFHERYALQSALTNVEQSTALTHAAGAYERARQLRQQSQRQDAGLPVAGARGSSPAARASATPALEGASA